MNFKWLVIALLLAGCQSTPTVTSRPSVSLDPKITPGIVITTSAKDVCTPGWAGDHRKSLTKHQKEEVLKAYGLPTSIKVGEWDHLIALELGGGNGEKNIWPQISTEDKKAKDKLENSLHKKVCDGDMKLTTAQQQMREYWKYVK